MTGQTETEHHPPPPRLSHRKPPLHTPEETEGAPAPDRAARSGNNEAFLLLAKAGGFLR